MLGAVAAVLSLAILKQLACSARIGSYPGAF